MTTQTPHRWRFFRTGGLDQVRLETGADLANLDQLDQKLWVALACPVNGLEFDAKTLEWIDTDHDGRVRVPEILGAIAYCKEALKSLDGLIAGVDLVPLASLREDTVTGRKLLGAARQILKALGRPEATVVGLADVADTGAIFSQTRFNGDGVVTAGSAGSPELAQAITDAVAVVGGDPDRCGESGVSLARLDTFYAELAAFAAWQAERAAVLPLGEATDAAVVALQAVRAKVDDYFARCRISAFDATSQESLNPSESAFAVLGAQPLTASVAEATHLPLSHIAPGRALPLEAGLNPAWSAAVATFRAATLAPIFGAAPAQLSEADWARVTDQLAPHFAWLAKKPPTKADTLGIERVTALLASDAKEQITALVAQDQAFADDFDGVALVEKLARFHRDLYRLLQNFTAFTDFYAPGRKSVFQAGTLFLDSRSCDLCVRVADAGRHAAMAGLSKCYLAYCNCTRKDGSSMQIAAVFSAGDSDFLMVGRNGVFYDRQGVDWDATITKVVENPISLREAFFAPYKKFLRFVEEQVNKRAAAADSASTARLAGAAETAATVDAKAPPAPGFDLSTIALIGVAVSGAAAVIGGILEAFFGLGMWMPLGFLGIVLAISGPSMLIAGLKLRQRNLGPILDANGWAINGRVAVNIPFGGSLTQMQAFPPGSQRTLVDPYEPRKSPWVYVARAVAALGVLAGVTLFAYHQGLIPAAVEQRLGFLGVPSHLEKAKVRATTSVEEQKAVVASAQEQVTTAKAALDARLATGEPPDAKLERAQARLGRAEAKLVRAEDRLDVYELQLEGATEALDVAIDASEAREAAAEAAP